MGFPRQEYRSGLPFPSQRDLPNLGIESKGPAQQADSLLMEPPVKCKPSQSSLQKSKIDLNILALRTLGEHSQDHFFSGWVVNKDAEEWRFQEAVRNLRSYLF